MGKTFILFVLLSAQLFAQHNVVKNGYCDKKSYFPGDTALLYLSSYNPKSNATIFILNANNEIVDSIHSAISPQAPNHLLPAENGFHYALTSKYKVPNIKSGVYSIDNKTYFVVKNLHQNALITTVYNSNTDNAYDTCGGKSLYNIGDKHALQVSFLRPEITNNKIFASGFIKWAEKQNYDMQWICDMDLEDYSSIENSTLLIIPGHSEYWTRKARLNFDKFVDQDKNALILSGNTMWWQVRYTNDKTGMICYKIDKGDTLVDHLYKTTIWSDTSLKYPIVNSIGSDWNHGGFGNQGGPNVNKGYKVHMPNSPLLEGTRKLKNDTIHCTTDEYDGLPTVGYTSDNIPILDSNLLKFCIAEIIASDGAKNSYSKRGNGSIITFKRSPSSGIIVNTNSTEWCSNYDGICGKDSLVFRKITDNAIRKLSQRESVFRANYLNCKNVNVEEISNKVNFTVFPNPAQNTANLIINANSNQVAKIIIYDAIGQIIEEKINYTITQGNNTIQLDLANFTDGIYFVNISSESQNATATLVVQK